MYLMDFDFVTKIGMKKKQVLSQAAACDGNNYTTSAGEQNPTPSTLPIY